MTDLINRREFLRKTTAGVAPVTAPGALLPLSRLWPYTQYKGSVPKRLLGKTGVKVSQLAFGGGSRFMMYKSDDEAIRVLNWVIDNGINYLDTAHTYGDGESERRFGEVMKNRRQEVFL